MSRFDEMYLNYGDVYSIIIQAKTVDQAMNVLHLPYVEMPKWVPATERLPDSGGLYFVTLVSGEVATSYFNGEGRRFSGFKDVKAWMPLPEPYRPKEGRE